MPSDPRRELALAALAPRRAGFRAALAAARDQVLAHLAAHGGTRDRVTELGAELGRFAGGRIDVSRLALVVATAPGLDAATLNVVRRCADVLDELLDEGDALFSAVVPPGGDLRATVDAALAEAGRAFGAVLAFHAATTGAYDSARHERGLHAFPYARWNRAERAIGVPLVVRVAGADLCAEALAEFLDGQQQLVLVVDGPAAPAPLARLVSPNVLVLQSTKDLGPVTSFEGPAIAALMPDGATELVSDPRAGADALVVRRQGTEPKAAVGRWSIAQQREQLAVLDAIARPRPLVPAGTHMNGKDGTDVNDSGGSGSSGSNPSRSIRSVESTHSVVGVARQGATPDAQLTESIASWLLAEAGLAGGAKA